MSHPAKRQRGGGGGGLGCSSCACACAGPAPRGCCGASLFMSLPQGLCSDLLAYLPHRSLCSLACTCRALRAACAAERLWQEVTVPASAQSTAALARSGRPVRSVSLRAPLSGDTLTSLAPLLSGMNALRELHVSRGVPLGDVPLAALAAHEPLEVLEFIPLPGSTDAVRALCRARGPTLRELTLLQHKCEGHRRGGDGEGAALHGLALAACATGPLTKLERLEVRVTLAEARVFRMLLTSCGVGEAPLPALRRVGPIGICGDDEELAGEGYSEQLDVLMLVGCACPRLEVLLVSELCSVEALTRIPRLRKFRKRITCDLLASAAAAAAPQKRPGALLLPLSDMRLECLCGSDDCPQRMAAFLESCPRTRRLSVYNRFMFDERLVRSLTALSDLQVLSLCSGSDVTDEALEILRGCTARVRNLTVNGCAGYSRLFALPMFSKLQHFRAEVCDVCESDIERLTEGCGASLRSVEIKVFSKDGERAVSVSDAGLSLLLTRCRNLELLSLHKCTMEDLLTCMRCAAFAISPSRCKLKFYIRPRSPAPIDITESQAIAISRAPCFVEKLAIRFARQHLPRNVLWAFRSSDRLHTLTLIFENAESFAEVMTLELCGLLPKSLARLKVYTNGAAGYDNPQLRIVAEAIHRLRPSVQLLVSLSKHDE